MLTPEEKNATLLGEIPNLDLLFLTELYGTQEVSIINSKGSFNDTGWSFSIDGSLFNNPISLSYTGTFDLGTDIGSFQSSGSYAGETWLSSGTGTFIQATDELIIENQVQLGSNSIEAIIRGAEKIAGRRFRGGELAATVISDILIDIIKEDPPPVTPNAPKDSDPDKPGKQVPGDNIVKIEFENAGNVVINGNINVTKNSTTGDVKTECVITPAQGIETTPSQEIECATQAIRKVPESTSVLGILVLGSIGTASILKREHSKKQKKS